MSQFSQRKMGSRTHPFLQRKRGNGAKRRLALLEGRMGLPKKSRIIPLAPGRRIQLADNPQASLTFGGIDRDSILFEGYGRPVHLATRRHSFGLRYDVYSTGVLGRDHFARMLEGGILSGMPLSQLSKRHACIIMVKDKLRGTASLAWYSVGKNLDSAGQEQARTVLMMPKAGLRARTAFLSPDEVPTRIERTGTGQATPTHIEKTSLRMSLPTAMEEVRSAVSRTGFTTLTEPVPVYGKNVPVNIGGFGLVLDLDQVMETITARKGNSTYNVDFSKSWELKGTGIESFPGYRMFMWTATIDQPTQTRMMVVTVLNPDRSLYGNFALGVR
ncbi:hypothetical protein GF318_02315 [Candidatus Micrarchaeota archaeon]|nr:hypothetical protein [Candidatus Micrarchaeota archaeon]